LILAGSFLSPGLFAQVEKIKPGDWPRYNRDLGGRRYSPLAQITPRNAGNLKLAWKYLLRTEAERAGPAAGFGYSEITPIVVNGMMYLTAGARVLALDPDRGKEWWVYEQKQGRPSNRGGKRNTGRINVGGPIVTASGLLFIGATSDQRFRAFESKTGKQLWETKLEYDAIATPITYLGKTGKQYVAISASGGVAVTDSNPANTEALYVFALP
jgi:glucose dehydrogenase